MLYTRRKNFDRCESGTLANETRVIVNTEEFGSPAMVDGTYCVRKVSNMIVGDRLRSLRETKNLSQGDIQQRTGLLRCYISRVENGHTVPSVETLEKMARALEVPLHQIFYDGEEPLKLPNFPTRKKGEDVPWGSSGKDARILRNLRRLLKRVSESDRKLLIFIAQKMAQQTTLRAKTP